MDLVKFRSLFKSVETVSGSFACINAFVIPSGDAHNSEYVAECDQRRAFASGFTGSAGLAVVTDTTATLFTDGRYWIQAENQLSGDWSLQKLGMPSCPTTSEYLIANLNSGDKVGMDLRHITHSEFKAMSKALCEKNIEIIGVKNNLVDLVWAETGHQPSPPHNEVFVLDEKFSGMSVENKLVEVRNSMAKKSATALLVSALDEVAWLFNLRGADISFNPVFMSYAVVTDDAAYLFVDETRLQGKVFEHLENANVSIKKYEDFLSFVNDNVSEWSDGGSLWVGNTCSQALFSLIPDGKADVNVTPTCHLKAVKNDIEVEGMKNCHIRDAVAVCKFFEYMEKRFETGNNLSELTECFAADVVAKYRSEQAHFVSLSFDSISSIGGNGAIIHYKPEPDTCDTVDNQRVYLLDSGGQYLDGTTDITRTVHFGTPSDEEKRCFTLVLKGHIALARAIFPEGTTGRSLDPFARQFLWREGLDFKHGTGHGVGSFLNVHEGPIGISYRKGSDMFPLKDGMVVTNEPGYYCKDAFGIRIENCVIVRPAPEQNGFLCLEDATLVPIQARMVEKSMLSEDEISWLNAYHARCLDIVGKELLNQGCPETLEWLNNNCQPF
eukprot:m.27335 g.27335  ORF g.27335 m.27335 type:complete len:610 (+) comp5932_c0_seq1:36-1865(+)